MAAVTLHNDADLVKRVIETYTNTGVLMDLLSEDELVEAADVFGDELYEVDFEEITAKVDVQAVKYVNELMEATQIEDPEALAYALARALDDARAEAEEV